MSSSEIEFSAQFGGRDAAQAALPHFRALKAAAKGILLEGFPWPQLAFILRVDGEVTQYGLVGAGNPEVDRSGKYLSIDIGLTRRDRQDLTTRLTETIRGSGDLIVAAAQEAGRGDVDRDALELALRTLLERYAKSESA